MTTPDLLATLDAEETRLLTQLAEVRTTLATLRRLTGTPPPPHGPVGLPTPLAETPPGKAEARPSSDGPGERPAGRPRDPDRPLAIARALLAGPLTTGELGAAVGLPLSSLHRELMRPIDPPWWGKQGNQLSPWELTPAGRAAAAAPGPSPAP